ncbi:hypothetical protein BCL80_1158 [Streptomyces avidinii]|nr:hypothetical protein BCL80_1158 [Streptomyces avidinii]SNX80813.1 hypothetical protein SAMN05421860_1138 [Streptomyces microflavus]
MGSPLGAAFAEYGQMTKTEHLLRAVDPVDAAAEQLGAEGHEIRDDDIARLSPSNTAT